MSKLCVAVPPLPSSTVNSTGYVPAREGVPESVAVLFPLSVKVSQEGNVVAENVRASPSASVAATL